MRFRLTPPLAIAAVFAFGVANVVQAQAPRDPRTGAARTAKGPLPDPVLLDGSKFEAEKRSEYGMLGEFDIAGDEKAETERVGSQGQGEPGGSEEGPGGNQGSAKAGAGKEGGEGQGGGEQIKQGAEGAAQAAQENGGQGAAEGTQIKELQGASQSGSAGQSSSNAKPGQLSIGDTAMQIKPQTEIPGVVGTQQQPVGKDVPQQYDKNTPAGGKQSPSRGNRGVEKGREMPAGI